MEWAKASRLDGLKVQGGFFPSYNFELKTYVTLRNWFRSKTGINLDWIALGGLKMRSEADMRHWLLERQAAGLEGIAASFVGTGAVHDRWTGRHGDFEFLLRTLHTAVELGLSHGTTLFLTKSSLPLMDELVQKLDALATPHKGRHVRPFYYIGHGAHHDAERLTEADRENLPNVVIEGLGPTFTLRSEREWIEAIRAEEVAPKDLFLHLELSGENIDDLEAMSCEEIFSDLESRARASLSAFPSLQELAEIYGDRGGTKLYMIPIDVHRLWLDRYLDAHPTELDHSLLHYHLGRSSSPPPLWDA